MPPDPDYHPQSLDANLARIFAKLETIETTTGEIRIEAKKTNGRITALERFRDILTAKVSLISFGIGTTVAASGVIINLLLN